ncbi:MAG: RluA family pseudouridine synthase [bacterium]
MRGIRTRVCGIERPTRLDRALLLLFPYWGRHAVRSLINAGGVRVNGRVVWLCSWMVEHGDEIEVARPPEEKLPPPAVFDDAWIISLEDDLIAVNKPVGLLSHDTHGARAGNLLDLSIRRFGALSLFHRLDRDASGIVILTRPGPINRFLDTAFKAGTVGREYCAAVAAPNRLAPEGCITAYIGSHPRRRDMMSVKEKGGLRAITRYQVTGESQGVQWVRLWPETGRTHQLRIHMAFMGAPILGDRLYGPLLGRERKAPSTGVGRLMLHACRITLPGMGGMPERAYGAPLPEDFLTMIEPSSCSATP